MRSKKVPSSTWDYRWMEYPGTGKDVKHPCDQSLMTYRGHAVLRTLVRCYFSPAFSADNWRFAADEFVKKFPDKLIVHCSESNASLLTFDGVDVMGERLAEEVQRVIKGKPGVKKISFIAHSVGGLVARYAIGRLYEPCSRGKPAVENGQELTDGDVIHFAEEQAGGKIAGLEPVNFITVATPHLGSKGHKQVPFLCSVPLFEKIARFGVHWVIGRTGRHLFLTDDDEGKLPLLRRMVSGLRAFKRCVAYSNVNYDQIVGWQTSSIRREIELPELQAPIDERYPHIVYVENETDDSVKPIIASSNGGHASDPEEGCWQWGRMP